MEPERGGIIGFAGPRLNLENRSPDSGALGRSQALEMVPITYCEELSAIKPTNLSDSAERPRDDCPCSRA